MSPTEADLAKARVKRLTDKQRTDFMDWLGGYEPHTLIRLLASAEAVLYPPRMCATCHQPETDDNRLVGSINGRGRVHLKACPQEDAEAPATCARLDDPWDRLCGRALPCPYHGRAKS